MPRPCEEREVGGVTAAAGSEAVVVDAVRRDDDRRRRVEHARGGGRRCARSRAISARARRALDPHHRRKNATLLRSCHSGWSKNVRSCTVTTAGTVEPQRHRVVRAVPDVDAEPLGQRAGPGPAPRPGARAGARGPRRGSRPWARGPPTAPRRPGGRGDAGRARHARRGPAPAAPCRRRHRRDARAPPRRRAAGARGSSLRARRASPRGCVRVEVGLGGRRPREVAGPAPAAGREVGPRGRRRPRRSMSAAVQAATSPGRDEHPGVADDLGERGRVGRDHRAAARHRLERREPEALVPRRERAELGPAVERVERRLVDPAEPAHARAVEAGDRQPTRSGPRARASRQGGCGGRSPPRRRACRGPCAARSCRR